MLCIYYPLSDVVKNGNISNEERMTLLESYSKCMQYNFKEITKEAGDKRKDLQDILLKNLCFKSSECSATVANTTDHIVYDMCGYLLYARNNLIFKLTGNCKECRLSLETKRSLLPADFYGGKLVEIRERYGGLKYCTPNMFEVFKAVEMEIQQPFNSEAAYVRDSFDIIIEKISQLTIPAICCTLHREVMVPRLIYEYVVFRYRFHAKQERTRRLELSKSIRKGKRKLSKLAKAPASKKKKNSSWNIAEASSNPVSAVEPSQNNPAVVEAPVNKPRRGRPPAAKNNKPTKAASNTEKQQVINPVVAVDVPSVSNQLPVAKLPAPVAQSVSAWYLYDSHLLINSQQLMVNEVCRGREFEPRLEQLFLVVFSAKCCSLLSSSRLTNNTQITLIINWII